MSTIMDGKELAEEIRAQLKAEIKKLKIKPKLAVIMAGSNPASEVYVKAKEKACKEAGIELEKIILDGNASEKKILDEIEKLNNDKKVNGILVQLPLPKHVNIENVMKIISPEKDVDGFSPLNYGNLLIGDERLAPCTPKGIIRILEHYRIPLEGKEAVIIGHSNIVGKPLALMLLNRNATVAVCHIFTKNLKEHTSNADIVVSAAGVAGLVKADMVKEGAVLIDVGISRIGDQILGDFDFEGVRKKASYITPVPGGIGPMTVAMLIENIIEVCRK